MKDANLFNEQEKHLVLLYSFWAFQDIYILQAARSQMSLAEVFHERCEAVLNWIFWGKKSTPRKKWAWCSAANADQATDPDRGFQSLLVSNELLPQYVHALCKQ